MSKFKILYVLLLVLLAACAPEPNRITSPTQTPYILIVTATPDTRPTSEVTIVVLDRPVRATPPPTWTPTQSPTPLPTATEYPTDTPIPTFTIDQLCIGFAILQPVDGTALPFIGRLPFVWSKVPLGGTMQIRINKKQSVAGLQLDIPFAGNGTTTVPLRLLPDNGDNPTEYEWQAWVQYPGYGRICDRIGRFTRAAPEYF